MSVSPEELAKLLHTALQPLEQRVTAAETKVATLEARIAKLERGDGSR